MRDDQDVCLYYQCNELSEVRSDYCAKHRDVPETDDTTTVSPEKLDDGEPGQRGLFFTEDVMTIAPAGANPKYLKTVARFKIGDTIYVVRVDVYSVIDAYAVTNPGVQHAVKKLLCGGARGVKSEVQDYEEAIQAIRRGIGIAQKNIE